ncbi:MAG: hypothetical protein AAF916_13195, partial [Planctomycetota bacterium]
DARVRFRFAEILWQLERDEDHIATLVSILKLPDLGLTHAEVNELLARAYLRISNLVQAESVAELAAESHASWAMQTAAVVQEAAGNFERAEEWLDKTADRYDRAKLMPAVFALRTGREMAADQRARVNGAVEELADSRMQYGLFNAAAYRVLEGELEAALAILGRDAPPSYRGELLRVVISNRLGETEIAAEARAAFCTALGRRWPQLASTASIA